MTITKERCDESEKDDDDDEEEEEILETDAGMANVIKLQKAIFRIDQRKIRF